MWYTFILNFLGGPIVNGLLNAYQTKLKSDDTITQTKARLAAQAILLDTREAELSSQERIALMGRPWAAENLFGYVLLFYYAKSLVWDAALHLGSTDAIRGPVATWSNLIVAFYFSGRTILNAMKIWKSK